jgi:hypothetical protein
MTADLDELIGSYLTLVQGRLGFDLVMVTRTDGLDWRVVAATENGYEVTAGDVFRWSDSICSRMVAAGDAQWTLPDVAGDEVASVAPVRSRLDIGAYAGAAILGPDGGVVGTVCAIDPAARDEVDDELLAFASGLAAYAFGERTAAVQLEREAERRPFRSDPACPAVVPPAAWKALLDLEVERSRWTDEPLAVALVRLRSKEGGSQRRTDLASVLAAGLGCDHTMAVLGSNRIGVLGVAEEADELQRRIEAAVGDVATSAVSSAREGPTESTMQLLERELVGDAAAAARAASQLLRYEFCDACGRKGVYRSAAVGIRRCRFCSVVV